MFNLCTITLAIVFCFLQLRVKADAIAKDYQDNNINEQADNKTETVTKIQIDSISRFHHAPSNKWMHRIPDMEAKNCEKPAKCEALNYSHCMGVKLPYSSTSLDLIDLPSQEAVQEKLHLYQGFKNVPKCWTVIQPFLCSLYMPKCENGKVDLPSKELCRNIFGPCRIFLNTTFFSDYLKCEDERLFRPNCKNVVKELKFQNVGQCLDPLIQTDSAAWFYEGIILNEYYNK